MIDPEVLREALQGCQTLAEGAKKLREMGDAIYNQVLMAQQSKRKKPRKISSDNLESILSTTQPL